MTDFQHRLNYKKFYEENMPEIIDLARMSMWLTSYPLELKANKNEKGLWYSIRSHSTPFYPEFPVLNYFVDFANPYHKIILEADSAKYHDPEKDRERDKLLHAHGWTTFRVCYQATQENAGEEGDFWEKLGENDSDWESGLRHFFLFSSDGLLSAIDYVYYKKSHLKCNLWEAHRDAPEGCKRSEWITAYNQYAIMSLFKHANEGFVLPGG
jgi:very-short-patch-repair endonuclease